MKLSKVNPGKQYQWMSFLENTPELVKEIFRDYGILPGSKISIESIKIDNSKIIIRWEGTILGLDQKLAEFVEVEPVV
jgi:hypothetical protein